MKTGIAASLLATAMMVSPALAAESAPAHAGTPATESVPAKGDAKSEPQPQVASAKHHARGHRHHSRHAAGKGSEAKAPAPTK